jgi:hypothetical protein
LINFLGLENTARRQDEPIFCNLKTGEGRKGWEEIGEDRKVYIEAKK